MPAFVRLILSIVLIWLSAGSGSAAAAETVVFGPQTLTRTTAAPNTYRASFALPAGLAAPFRLRLDNGLPDGSARVSSAVVSVNGVQIAGPNDFSQQVAFIERPVALTPNNTLELKVAGVPGSQLTVRVFGTWPASVPVAVTPSPLALTVGAVGEATVTLAPAPRQAGSLALSTDPAGIAGVPASIGFAIGQTAVPVAVRGLAAGSAVLTASANDGSASGTLQVTPAPPTVGSLLPSTLSLTQGGSGQLTVTLSAAQSSDVAVSLASTDPTRVSVPGSVVVRAGQSSTVVPVSAIAPGSAQVTAALNGSSSASQVTVAAIPAQIVSLLPATSTVTLGASATLQLTLSVAPTAPTDIILQAAPTGLVGVPERITVEAGQVSAAITVNTLALGTASVAASLNGSSASAALQIVPPAPAIVSLLPNPLNLTQDATGQLTVTLNAQQQANTEITLTAADPTLVRLPATVTVPAGQLTASVAVTGLAVGSTDLSASLDGSSQSTRVNIAPYPPAPVSLLPNPLPLQEGASGSLRLTLNAAQLTDVALPVANSAPAIVQAPTQLVVPAGRTDADLSVTGLAAGTATLTVSLNGALVQSLVEVTPPPPLPVGLAPDSLVLPKGVPGTLTVTVSRAPAVATPLALASSDPQVAEVPSTVTLAAGALSASFPVIARKEGQASITVALNGGSSTAQVSVTAPELTALTLSPQAPTAYVGETLAFNLQGTYTDASQQDLTTQALWRSSSPAVASIASTGVASALAEGQTDIAAGVGSQTAGTALHVELVPTLAFAPNGATLRVGDSFTLTLASTAPAGAEGLPVALTYAGLGSVSGPANLLVPAGQSSVGVVLTGLTPGELTITATAPRRVATSASLAVVPRIAITGLNPTTGPVGSPVTLSGQHFDPNPAGNDVRFNGERAIVATASTDTLKVLVPVRASSGPVTVTTAVGTATSSQAFTVQRQQDFDLTLLPAAVQAPAGGFASVRVRLASTGLLPYAHAVTLNLPGLPAGITASLERPTVYVNGDSTVLLKVPAGTPAGSYALVIEGVGPGDIGSLTRAQSLNLEVLPANATTVTGRVLHTEDDRPFAGARIRLGGGETYTDASGYYRVVNPPVLGDQILLIDGHPQATAEIEYPSAIAMPVFIEAGKDNRALTSYIQGIDTRKFASVTPGVATAVTVPDIPNYSLNIPQGAVLYGWDGTPVTKINVRTVPADRLPIKPLPPDVEASTVYLYYFFREGGANPTQPIPVTMVNDQGALPGEKIELWYYDESITPDANSNQWRLMGLGTVSDDGKSIVSDPGVGIPKFCCGASAARNGPGAGENGANGGDGAGDASNGGEPPTCPNSNPPQPTSDDPVDLATGNNLAFQMRGFGIASLLPVNLTCNYRSTDPRIGAFGRGASFAYDWFAEAAGTAVRITTPDGVRYLLAQGTDGVYRASDGRIGALGWEVRATTSGRTLRFKRGREMDFDAAGRLLVIRDPDGNTIRFTRDANGFVSAVTDPNGRGYAIETLRVTSGRTIYTLVSKITDALGRSQSFTYDAQMRLQTHTDAGGGVTRYEYDTAGRIAKKTEPLGGVLSFTYDSYGRTVKEVLQDGTSTVAYVYNPTDLDGLVGSSTTTSTTRQVTASRMIDANGHATEYRFNGQGYLTRETDAIGRIRTYTRDYARNLVTAATDPAGRTVQYEHDTLGNLTLSRDALGHETRFEYAPGINKLSKITDALGNVSRFQYDAKGRLIEAADALGQTVRTAWTTRGQLASLTDALGQESRFTYDGDGNLIAASNPLGQSVRRTYDDANRLLAAIDALGNTSERTYDALDRVTQITDALGGITRLMYDADDRLLTVTDPRGNVVERNAYDLRGRLTSRTDAAGVSSSYSYDPVGNLIETTDRKGQRTRYTYDAINRVTRVEDADGRVTTTDYDLAGNVAAIRDNRSGDLLFAYDALDRPIRIVADQGTVEYAYDALGRRIQRTVNGGDPVTYSYDAVGRLTGLDYRGKQTRYQYDAAGRLVQKTLPNGFTQTLTWDAANQLTALTATRADGSGLETVTYAYDAAGRRIARGATVAGVPETPMDAIYDSANRLTSLTLGGIGYTLGYDANGNLTTKTAADGRQTAYTWDAHNRLSRIDGPAGSASFRYDALGRRIEKTVSGQSVQYLYDGAQAIAELRGGAVAATLLTGLAIDEVIARYTAAGERTLLTDALGSVLLTAQEDGAVQTAYGYSPYGETQLLGTDEANPVQYTARENDGTGLYYYRARYYDPQLKRFISEDPIGLDGGINVYSYVSGNPVSYSDPLGLLTGTTLGGVTKGMTTGDATAVGSMGNAALITGSAGGATMTAAEGVAGAYISLPAAIKRAIGILKGISDDAMPAPVPPEPPIPIPPAIIRPGVLPPPITPPRGMICRK